jgi:hypothetical protein
LGVSGVAPAGDETLMGIIRLFKSLGNLSEDRPGRHANQYRAKAVGGRIEALDTP